MRLATSGRKFGRNFGGSSFGGSSFGVTVALALSSFALGVVVSRPPLSPTPSGAERELVSGASVPLAAPTSGAQSTARQVAPAASPALEASRPARSTAPEPSWSQLAARAQRWTAAVRADQNYGAGVLVNRSGLVLTNLHVIASAHTITVTPLGGTPSAASVLDSDAELDLALLGASLPSPLTEAASLGSASALAVGDEVLAVGSPRKMYFSVSRGMVSFPNRLLEGVEYVQTDLPINEGNSGGPLVDRGGRVVGIVSFILRESQGLSFALPIDRAVTRFAAYLAPAPGLGVQEAAAEQAPVRAVPAREPPARRAH